MNPTSSDSKQLNILYASKSPGFHVPIADAISQAGYLPNPTFTHSTDDFLSHLNMGSTDIILCDYDAPIIDTSRELSEQHPELATTPLIYISENASDNDVLLAIERGAKDLILNASLKSLIPSIAREARSLQTRRDGVRHQERYKEIIHMSSDAILALDAGWKITFYNQAAEQLFGYNSTEILGQPYSTLMDASNFTGKDTEMHTPATTEQFDLTKRRDVSIRCKDGSLLTVEMNMSRSNVKGDERTYTVILRDISDRKTREEELEHLANYDTLTGIYNRYSFYTHLEQEIERSKRDNMSFAVLYLDLDGFKPINDSLGHDAGDIVLKKFAKRLKNGIRTVDFVARLGGDEFVVILHNVKKIKLATKVAEKIIDTFSVPFNVKDEKVYAGTSIGISIYPEHTTDAETLVKYADSALYQSKANGKNNYTLYDKDISKPFSAENFLPV